MEVPIQVAVRLRPPDISDSPPWLVTDPINQAVMTGSGQVFHVDNALPLETTQAYLYSSIVATQVNCFLDGCDTSIVMFGQSKTGKTYTLLGPGADSIYGDQDRGIIPRFIQDVFQRLHQASERTFIIHLTWMRVTSGRVLDLLGCGLVRCSSVAEAFQYLNKGSINECYEPSHTVFTVSIEQKWIGAGGILHHRLSTASFCELSGYPEPSLNNLEDIVKSLLQPMEEKAVNYEQSLLTAMLRDSFGGRAFTWIICCLSSDLRHSEESIKNLELCWCCRGVRNFVTVNGFADNNTPVVPEKELNRPPDQMFGLQFAAQQWIKLVSNAEGLFQKLLQSNMIGEAEAAQINEWLFLKAECDECLTPAVVIGGSDGDPEHEDTGVNKQPLPRIAEDTEPSELSDFEGDSDTDTSVQHDDFLFTDKLCKYMEFFREKTDELASDRCEEYLHCGGSDENLDNSDTCLSESSAHVGRRKTIQPGESLSGSDLELLRRAAAKAISPESQQIIMDSHKTYADPEPKLVQRELLKMIDSPVPSENCKKYKTLLQKYSLKQSLVTKLSKEIQDGEEQLKELLSLCLAKEQLIQDLSKIVKRQNNAKQCTEKQSNIKEEYEKAKADLVAAQAKYIVGNGNPRLSQQVRKCKSIVDHYERRVQDLEVSKRVDCDSNKEIKKHENKLKAYRKQIDVVKKQIKRDEKRKSSLELELIRDKSKLDDMYEKDLNFQGSEVKSKEKKQPTLKQVSARITHLDHILKEKSSDLQKCQLSDDKESMLRREIRNLRRTRECLIDQRCILGQKRKTHKSLSDTEERKILECEEAIEAIDTAIEYKNELICARGPVRDVTALGQKRERGEEMLMARLSKLSDNEMRTLLYKYFQKVIDLRGTCVSLEAQAGAAAREAGGWRRRCADAWAALHHARLMHARRTTTLTARHYHTLNQLMREMTGGDTESDGSMYGNNVCGRMPLSLEFPPGNGYGNTDSETDAVLTTQHRRIASTTAKVKLKDNPMEGNARFLDGIQHLARYHQTAIPSQNLKQLQPASHSPATRVTREKNKLVIVQEDKPKNTFQSGRCFQYRPGERPPFRIEKLLEMALAMFGHSSYPYSSSPHYLQPHNIPQLGMP